MTILAHPRMQIARDYLVPLPSAGMDGAVARMAEYSDVAAMTRALFEELLLPVTAKSGSDNTARWVRGVRKLLPAGWADAFTEHSERKVLVSWLPPHSDISLDHLDLLGNWSFRGSKGYDQSAGRIVADLQLSASRSLAAFAAKYGEDDLREEVVSFVTHRYGMQEARNVPDCLFFEPFKETLAKFGSKADHVNQACDVVEEQLDVDDEPAPDNAASCSNVNGCAVLGQHFANVKTQEASSSGRLLVHGRAQGRRGRHYHRKLPLALRTLLAHSCRTNGGRPEADRRL